MRYFLLCAIVIVSGCVDHEYSKWVLDHRQLCWNLGGNFERNPGQFENADIRCLRGGEILFIKKFGGTK